MTTKFEDSFSKEVWASTYKDHKDENIDQSLSRVAKAVASVEKNKELRAEWEENFFKMLSNFHVTVGGRIYSNAGTEWGGTTLMNCFVGPRPAKNLDSLDGILTNLSNQAKTLKSEGGWGENFSYMRPRGMFIHGIGVETPGSVKYMELFDKSSEIITSGSGKKSTHKKAKGKIRKGAMMGVLDVWHPDIVEFITAKQQAGRLSKFNMSVNCTDEFMAKVIKVLELKDSITMYKTGAGARELSKNEIEDLIQEADKWDLRFPDTTFEKYDDEWSGDLKSWEAKGYPVVVIETVSVSGLWELIMKSTYNRAEPGVLFLDRANYYNPGNYFETIFATNPCGEQTLSPGNICCLGSINLTQFINQAGTGFNLPKLAKYTKWLVRFLDNVNSLSNAPLPEYEESMHTKRRIGCGILGWGSALYILKTRYGSDEAEAFRDQVMKTISRNAYMASIDLAEEKGKFKLCKPAKHAKGAFIQTLGLPSAYMEKLTTIGIRNSCLLSLQPTGNTSILANIVSGGCEPTFMHEYIRTVIVNTMPEHIADVCPKWYEGEFEETKMFKFKKEGDETILRGTDENGTVYKIDKNRGLTKEVLCEDYGVRHMKKLGEWDASADWAATTLTLTVDDHLRELKGFAQYVDSAISKTINLPFEFKFDDFKSLYIEAYKTGYIKGLTTYRAGTMTSVLSSKESIDSNGEEIILDDVKLPDSSPAVVKTLRAESRKWYLTVVYHEDNNRPFALFVKTNATEKNVVADEAVELLMKLAKKKKIPKRHCDDVSSKIGADSNSSKVTRVVSFLLRHGVLIKNIVATLDRVESAYVGTFVFMMKKFLATYIKDGEKVEDEKCQECGSASVVFSEGCKKCTNCGSSKCG